MAKCLDNELDAMFFALSDPTRRRMLEQLALGSCSVSELWKDSGMKLPSFTKHVTVLEESGLVETEKTGRVRRCTLRPDKLKTAQEWVTFHSRFWSDKLGSLEDYLALNSETLK